jgi:hypothetical protein
MCQNFQNAPDERVRTTSQPKGYSLELWDDSIERPENDFLRPKFVS